MDKPTTNLPIVFAKALATNAFFQIYQLSPSIKPTSIGNLLMPTFFMVPAFSRMAMLLLTLPATEYYQLALVSTVAK
jgi:hypothetical protein